MLFKLFVLTRVHFNITKDNLTLHDHDTHVQPEYTYPSNIGAKTTAKSFSG